MTTPDRSETGRPETRQPEFLTSPQLAKHSGIAHGFFTRRGGVSSGLYDSLNVGLGSDDDPAAIVENRALVVDALGSNARLSTAYQVHSADVAYIDRPLPEEGRPQVDAMVTNKPNVPLGILTADCGPVLFSDETAGVIGAAHAGWGGAFKGVTDATIEAMEQHGATRKNIVAAIGPCISLQSYEVGAEFYQRFVDDQSSNIRFFQPSDRSDHYQFNLPAYIEARLHMAEVGKVEKLDMCTYLDEGRFYSFRRCTHRDEVSPKSGKKDYGRQVSAIVLVE